MVVFFEGLVTTEEVVPNMPVGNVAFVQTDADVDIAWWDPRTQAYGATQTITTPGDEVSCPSYRAKLTAASANIRVVQGR